MNNRNELIEIWYRPNYGADSRNGIEHRPQRIDPGKIFGKRSQAGEWVKEHGLTSNVYLVRQGTSEIKWAWNQAQGWHTSTFKTHYVPQGTREAEKNNPPKVRRRPAWMDPFIQREKESK